MNIKDGRFYFILNSFFDYVKDENLKQNKDERRPHFLSFVEKDTELLWMVPCSTKVSIWKKRIHRFKNKNRVLITRINGADQVILFQNMFPVVEKYIKNEYKKLEIVDMELVKDFRIRATRIKILLQKGVKLSKFPQNVKRIEQLMLKEIGWSDNKIYEYQNRFNKNKDKPQKSK